MDDAADPVHGTAVAGFEPVRDLFAANVSEVGGGGAAFAAVVAGELVCDLWAGRAGDSPWRADTRAVIMSASKGVATVGVARLVDRGEIDVEAPMATYWPEFAAGGKQDVTVAQVLSHAAGLISVPNYEDLFKANGDGWDETEEIVRRLASAVPEWPPGSAFGYHAITFGWLIGELVRRVAGKSVGTLVREEIVGPLGLELDIGTPLERQDLVAPLVRGVAETRDVPRTDTASLAYRASFRVEGRSALDDIDAFMRQPSRLASEMPAANGTATARALAILYGALATGSGHDEVQLLSPRTIETFVTERLRGVDLVLGRYFRRGLGFELAMQSADGKPIWGPHEETFGHNGAGGQIAFADPVTRTGIGFVRSHGTSDFNIGSRLVDSFYQCLGDG